MIEATDQTFATEVEQSPFAVLVDFHAQWCGPCKALRPLLEMLEQRRGGTLKIVGVDFDRAPNVVAKYSIRSLPTMVLFRGGKVIGHRVGGAASVPELERMVDGAMASQ